MSDRERGGRQFLFLKIFIKISSRVVKSLIEINKDISTVLLIKNINTNIINELNNCLEIDLKDTKDDVKSIVAIAAAVTSYARIHI